MECKVTCFERVLASAKELPKDKLEEAVEITTEYNFQDFLDFCVENGCFSERESYTIYDTIVMWEDLEGNYWEEDHDNLMALYDKVGLTNEVVDKCLKY